MTCNKSQVCRYTEVLVLRIATRVHHVKEIGTGETCWQICAGSGGNVA